MLKHRLQKTTRYVDPLLLNSLIKDKKKFSGIVQDGIVYIIEGQNHTFKLDYSLPNGTEVTLCFDYDFYCFVNSEAKIQEKIRKF